MIQQKFRLKTTVKDTVGTPLYRYTTHRSTGGDYVRQDLEIFLSLSSLHPSFFQSKHILYISKIVMAASNSSPKSLHWVLKIGNLKKSLHFFENVLGLRVSSYLLSLPPCLIDFLHSGLAT
jgi:hypothetical protein